MITVTDWTEPLNASFSRTRWAYSQQIHQYSADDVNADDALVGLKGSRTTVFRIFSPKEVINKTCIYETDVEKLVKLLKDTCVAKLEATEDEGEDQAYHLPEGKEFTYKGDVWVYAEQEGGELSPTAFELIGKATDLASRLNEKVGAVLVGKDVGVAGIEPESVVLVGVGDKIAGRVGGVTTASSRGAFDRRYIPPQ